MVQTTLRTGLMLSMDDFSTHLCRIGVSLARLFGLYGLFRLFRLFSLFR